MRSHLQVPLLVALGVTLAHYEEGMKVEFVTGNNCGISNPIMRVTESKNPPPCSLKVGNIARYPLPEVVTPERIIESTDLGPCFDASRVLTQKELRCPRHCESYDQPDLCTSCPNYWLSPNNSSGSNEAYFVMDLGYAKTINRVRIINSQGEQRNRGTFAFRVYSKAGDLSEWVCVLQEWLSDVRSFSCDREGEEELPLKWYSFDTVRAKYVKFVVDTYLGDGGGLQLFEVYFTD